MSNLYNNEIPLYYAIKHGHLNMVKELLKSYFDINYVDFRGKTLLHIAVYNGNIEIVQELIINYKFNVNAIDYDGKTPLMDSAFYGNIDIVKELIKFNANINVTCNNNYTPLYYANAYQYKNIIKELFNFGMNINICKIQLTNLNIYTITAFNITLFKI